MSNDWLRLWHDMPNDPKWRTIAKLSKQPISLVISVYIHMLVCASNATERGRTQGWFDEDIATALDVEIEQIIAIRETMQGRVLEGDYLKGWESRQPKREDNSAERSKAWREKNKKEKEKESDEGTQPNADERKRPIDTDTDKKKNLKEKVSQLSEDLNLNDVLVCVGVVAELMGKKKLLPKEQEEVARWCNWYDMRTYALPLIEKELEKYRDRNKGNSPVSVTYFSAALDRSKPPEPLGDVILSLSRKMQP